MQSIRTINPVLRAVGVIGVVAVLAVSVTFAALSSNSVVLADNQFATGTAHLQIWNGSAFTDSPVSGFDFTNIIPGTETAPYTFYLKNTGDVPLSISSVSDFGAIPTNIVDPTQVTVKITNVDQSNVFTTYTLSQLWDSTPDALPGSSIGAGVQNQYDVTVLVAPGAVSGSSASLTNLDLTFTGVQP
jgi:hypothetical protein